MRFNHFVVQLHPHYEDHEEAVRDLHSQKHPTIRLAAYIPRS